MINNKTDPLRVARRVAFVLLFLTVGCAIFNWGLSYYYRAELSGGSCELCYKLNPGYEICRGIKKPDFQNLNFSSFNISLENGP